MLVVHNMPQIAKQEHTRYSVIV